MFGLRWIIALVLTCCSLTVNGWHAGMLIFLPRPPPPPSPLPPPPVPPALPAGGIKVQAGPKHGSSATCVSTNSYVPLILDDSSVIYNNLGGQGPDASPAPDSILFGNVGTLPDGSTLDLVVSESPHSQSKYRAYNPAANGLKRKVGGTFAGINLLAPTVGSGVSSTSTTLRFAFRKSATQQPVQLKRTFMTFFDLVSPRPRTHTISSRALGQYASRALEGGLLLTNVAPPFAGHWQHELGHEQQDQGMSGGACLRHAVSH